MRKGSGRLSLGSIVAFFVLVFFFFLFFFFFSVRGWFLPFGGGIGRGQGGGKKKKKKGGAGRGEVKVGFEGGMVWFWVRSGYFFFFSFGRMRKRFHDFFLVLSEFFFG
jgi:hypothetical protein